MKELPSQKILDFSTGISNGFEIQGKILMNFYQSLEAE
jgi:hypothetical protein